MICFRDRAYCSADCLTDTCSRNKEQLAKGGAQHEAYVRWSKAFGGDGPVAYMDLSDGCTSYRKKA